VATISLEARDRTGPRLTVLRIIAPGDTAIEVHPGENPVVQLTLNEEVVFEIVASDLSGPVTYTWTFGDGTTAQGSRVTHQFAAVGTSIVSVTMTDAAGNTNTTALPVNTESRGFFEVLTAGGGVLLIVLAVVVVGAVGVFALYRYRMKHRKNY
jgi:hypothetical protein